MGACNIIIFPLEILDLMHNLYECPHTLIPKVVKCDPTWHHGSPMATMDPKLLKKLVTKDVGSDGSTQVRIFEPSMEEFAKLS
jgi:hypothetical protein